MIKLIHLTDLHIGHNELTKAKHNPEEKKEAKRFNDLNDLLLEEYITLIKSEKPSLIIVSGDTIDGKIKKLNARKQKSVFEKAVKFLDAISLIVGPDKIIFCPGNHDREIAKINTNHKNIKYDYKPNAITDLIKNNSNHYQTYINLLEKINSPPLNGFNSRLIGTRVVKIKEQLNIGIISINSDWLGGSHPCQANSCLCNSRKNPAECYKEKTNEYARLRLGDEVKKCLDLTKDCKLTIGVLHHPPDWLHFEETYGSFNKNGTYNELIKNCNCVFMGHIHPQKDSDFKRENPKEILSGPQFLKPDINFNSFVSIVEFHEDFELNLTKKIVKFKHKSGKIYNEDFYVTDKRKNNIDFDLSKNIIQEKKHSSFNNIGQKKGLDVIFTKEDLKGESLFGYIEYYLKHIKSYNISAYLKNKNSFSVVNSNHIIDHFSISWINKTTDFTARHFFYNNVEYQELIAEATAISSSPIFWRVFYVIFKLKPQSYKIEIVDDISSKIYSKNISNYNDNAKVNLKAVNDLLLWIENYTDCLIHKLIK